MTSFEEKYPSLFEPYYNDEGEWVGSGYATVRENEALKLGLSTKDIFKHITKQEITDALAEPSNERVRDIISGRLTKQDMLDAYEGDIAQDELDEIDRVYDSYIPMYREHLLNEDISNLSRGQKALQDTLKYQSGILSGSKSFDQNQGIKLKPEDRELGPNDLGIWISPEEAEERGYKYLDEETRRLYKYDPVKKIKGMKHGGLVMNYGDY
ncbi:MAG TPA: hypothetical protein DCS66_03780, partial [Flavobacteriaceae bacterium]|nr:hypothetical protein [Flavobacteriaceae bacterium]